jgi:hypothetical protein
MGIGVISLRIPRGEKFTDLEGAAMSFIDSFSGKYVSKRTDGNIVTEAYRVIGDGSVLYTKRVDGDLFELHQVVNKGDERTIDRIFECNAYLTINLDDKNAYSQAKIRAEELLKKNTDTTLWVEE